MTELSTNQTKKPCLLYLVTQDDLGGAQKYIFELALAFRNRSEVTVAAGVDGNGWLSRQCEKDRLPFVSIPELRREISPLSDLKALRRIITLTKNFDLIHANSSKAGVLAALAAVGTKTRVIYTAHGWAFLEPENFFRRLLYLLMEWLAARLRQGTIVLSEREAAVARRWLFIRSKKLAVIPHGQKQLTDFLSRGDALQKLGLPDDASPVVGTIANFYKTKGLDCLLRAFAQVCSPELSLARGSTSPGGRTSCSPDARLVIIGDGPEKEKLRQIADQLPPKIADKIFFAGSRPEAWRLLTAFDLFVLPSRKEGLPFVLLEALAAGLPIVATDIGAVRETLGDAGLIVPPENSAALTAALSALIQDENRRRELLAAARARAAELRGRWGQMIEQTWRFYRLTATPQ